MMIASFRLVLLVLGTMVMLLSILLFDSVAMKTKTEANRSYSEAYTEYINLLAITQEMRRREKDFFLRKDIIYAKQYENLSQEAFAHIASMEKTGAGTLELAKLSELLEQHKREFMTAVSNQESIGFDLDKGIQGRMRKHIHELEDILVYKIKNDKLTIMLFTIRRNEKNFLLRMQSAPDQPTPEVTKDFSLLLKSLTLKPDVRKAAESALNSYLSEFKSLVAKEAALSRNVASLSSVFTDFERLHYQLLNQSRTKSQDSYQALLEFLRNSKTVEILLAAMALLFAAGATISLRKYK